MLSPQRKMRYGQHMGLPEQYPCCKGRASAGCRRREQDPTAAWRSWYLPSAAAKLPYWIELTASFAWRLPVYHTLFYQRAKPSMNPHQGKNRLSPLHSRFFPCILYIVILYSLAFLAACRFPAVPSRILCND